MDTRRLGPLDVTVVGLGCNNFGTRLDEAGTADVVSACLDVGVTFFDTAEVYGFGLSESYLGKALRGRRADALVATKFGYPSSGAPAGAGGSAKRIEQSVEGSLRRLGTDYIDLYQLHTPDPDTPIEETLGALNDLLESGKVRAVGCSNFSADQIVDSGAAAQAAGLSGWASVQNQYSLLHREPEGAVMAACTELGLGFLPYYPLHSGVLTGKHSGGSSPLEGTRLFGRSPEDLERFYNHGILGTVEALQVFSRERGHTLLELAFSWLLANEPVASVIAGASTPSQVAANAAAGSWVLSAADLVEVDSILGTAA